MNREFTVSLEEVFQGPMDLLLHLVREQEVEIHEVSISRVIDGYFEYLKNLENLDIEIAGEFLVMAATLMAIKSRSLLPREEVELEDELDPGDELIQRLIEYRRFKGASEDLDYRLHQRALEHPRGYRNEVRDNEPERTLDIGELTAWDLLSTFSRLMRETMANRTHHVKGDPRPLRWFVRSVGETIALRKKMSLREIVCELEDEPTREGMIGAFCALLELVRLGVVRVRQDEQDDEISLTLNEEAGDDIDALIGASRLMDEVEEEEESEQPSAEGEAGAEANAESDADASEADEWEEDSDDASEAHAADDSGEFDGDAPELVFEGENAIDESAQPGPAADPEPEVAIAGGEPEVELQPAPPAGAGPAGAPRAAAPSEPTEARDEGARATGFDSGPAAE